MLGTSTTSDGVIGNCDRDAAARATDPLAPSAILRIIIIDHTINRFLTCSLRIANRGRAIAEFCVIAH